MVMTVDELETALSIPVPEDDRLLLDDSRRLTGPGLLWKHYGANLDVFVEEFDKSEIAKVWSQEARKVLDAIGWQAERAYLVSSRTA